MPPNWALVATSSAAVVSFAGLLLTQRRGKKEDLDKKVERAVAATFGSSLLNLRQTEEATSKRISEAADQASQQLNEMVENASRRSVELDSRLEAADKLQQLVARAESLLPGVEASRALIPSLLLLEIRGSNDPVQARVQLAQLLDSPSVSSNQLEEGGDIARELVGDEPLARRFYDAAVKTDPYRVSARAELLRLQAFELGPDGSTALDALRALAKESRNQVATSAVLDAFVHRGAWQDMRDFANEALKQDPKNALLWRNLGVALRRLSVDSLEVQEAYDRAIDTARDQQDSGAFVNTARPYGAYLIQIDKLDKAETLIREAIGMLPLSADLYDNLGVLAMKRSDRTLARRCHDLAHAYGNPQERARANRKREEIAALDYLDTGLSVQEEP